MGAIRGGPRLSCVDTGGIGSLLLSHVWAAADAHGRRLEIYGSGGWGFKSLRAVLARIDRKLLSGLGQSETHRMVASQ